MREAQTLIGTTTTGGAANGVSVPINSLLRIHGEIQVVDFTPVADPIIGVIRIFRQVQDDAGAFGTGVEMGHATAAMGFPLAAGGFYFIKDFDIAFEHPLYLGSPSRDLSDNFRAKVARLVRVYFDLTTPFGVTADFGTALTVISRQD